MVLFIYLLFIYNSFISYNFYLCEFLDLEDPLGLKSKLLIKNFLSDKKKGLEIFFSFLRVTGIWQRVR